MAYTALGCEGLARCDFFVEKGTGRVMINEINTFPGFTSKMCIRDSHNSLVRQRCCSPAVPPVATSIAQFQGIKKRSAPRGTDLLMFKKER